jgi:hypothetical protein
MIQQKKLEMRIHFLLWRQKNKTKPTSLGCSDKIMEYNIHFVVHFIFAIKSIVFHDSILSFGMVA